MLRELQMLAKMAEDDERKPSERVNKLLAGASQGYRGMGTAERIGLLSLPLAPLIRKIIATTEGFPKGSVPQTREELHALVNKLEKGQAINPDIRLVFQDKPGQAEYRKTYPWKKLQREYIKLAPKSNPLTIAHEMGHAIQPNKLEKYLNIASGLARTPVATALPSILALTGGLSKDEEAPLPAKAAPFLGGAQLAAILGEETRANIRALKLLKDKGISTTTFQKLRQFVPSLSYLGRASLLVGAPLGILKGMELYEKSRKTDYPFTAKQLAGMTPEYLAQTPTPEDIKAKWKARLS